MWSSISSLPYSKSNVRHEETVLVSSMLFQISDCVKTFKIIFSQFKSVFRFINVSQTCFQTMLKRRIFTWSIEILGLFCKHLFGSSIDCDLEIAFRWDFKQHMKPNMFDFTFSILSLLSLFSSALFYRNISFNQETLRL